MINPEPFEPLASYQISGATVRAVLSWHHNIDFNVTFQFLVIIAFVSGLSLVGVAVRAAWLAIGVLLNRDNSRAPSREYIFFHTQLGLYAACLLAMNFITAVGGMIGTTWIAQRGISEGKLVNLTCRDVRGLIWSGILQVLPAQLKVFVRYNHGQPGTPANSSTHSAANANWQLWHRVFHRRDRRPHLQLAGTPYRIHLLGRSCHRRFRLGCIASHWYRPS